MPVPDRRGRRGPDRVHQPVRAGRGPCQLSPVRADDRVPHRAAQLDGGGPADRDRRRRVQRGVRDRRDPAGHAGRLERPSPGARALRGLPGRTGAARQARRAAVGQAVQRSSSCASFPCTSAAAASAGLRARHERRRAADSSRQWPWAGAGHHAAAGPRPRHGAGRAGPRPAAGLPGPAAALQRRVPGRGEHPGLAGRDPGRASGAGMAPAGRRQPAARHPRAGLLPPLRDRLQPRAAGQFRVHPRGRALPR